MLSLNICLYHFVLFNFALKSLKITNLLKVHTHHCHKQNHHKIIKLVLKTLYNNKITSTESNFYPIKLPNKYTVKNYDHVVYELIVLLFLIYV